MNPRSSLPEAAMHSIAIENFRCFGDKQTARLAPLTLLVGENSTGKTSFLALLRALDDFARGSFFPFPNFKQPPYDLGSFDEIAHYRGGRGGRAETFSAEFAALSAGAGSQNEWKLATRFGKEGTAPVPIHQRMSLGKIGSKDNNKEAWVAVDFRTFSIKMGTRRGAWTISKNYTSQRKRIPISEILFEIYTNLHPSSLVNVCKSEDDSPNATRKDMQDCLSIMREIYAARRQLPYVFSSAPVRSQPHRTYDPAHLAFDPEGDYVPMLLAEMSSKQPKAWDRLKQSLENFGRSAGLFDEIRIRHFGTSHSNPFQVQVRKSGKKQVKGPWRNLMDVGYGVSQALPIITELLRDDAGQQKSKKPYPRQFLLQQPEVHLHPSAQAALGSLFCQVAGPRRQLIVETHSDNLMDRVCMDVRDGVSGLKPEDVSILFFERRGLDVRIHSLRLDEEGDVLGAPDGYRQFFLDETDRLMWPGRPTGEA